MTISKARRHFRIFLGLSLIASLTFFSASVFLYVSWKNKTIPLSDIAPILFQMDVYSYEAKAFFLNDDDRHDIAKRLINRGFYSDIYGNAGTKMMNDLAIEGHNPSKFIMANLLLLTFPFTQENYDQALILYEDAAKKGYEPAQIKIAYFRNLERTKNNHNSLAP